MSDGDPLEQEDLDRLTSGEADATTLARVTKQLASSARQAGTRAVASGRWVTSTLIDVAPRIKVRDLATLREHHDGLEGADLAEALVRNASRTSAAIGAASGAIVSAQHFAPPTWVAWPLELVVETLAVAAIELKLVAELHEVFGRPVIGTPGERGMALVKAWAERRGVSAATLARPGGLADAFGRGTRDQIARMARRRLMARLGRNVSTLAPLLAGAVAAAEVNRRATRSLGDAITRDMAAAPTSPRASDL